MKTIDDLDFSVPKEIEVYTNHTAEIAIMISNYISLNGLNKKTFAELVGKTASDITRWVSGSHNFTILTLSLIESTTGLEIVKKLSNNNIKYFRESKTFEIKSEEDLLKEIKELRQHIEELNSNIAYSQVTIRGAYKDDNTTCLSSVLTGKEESTFDLSPNHRRKIRGNSFFVGKLLYAEA